MRTFIAVALLFGLCPVGEAENWPEFRGPTGQGISQERDLPRRWSASENIAWKRPLPGQGWSSPVVHDGRVYVTLAVLPDGPEKENISLRAATFDAETGKPGWNVEVFSHTSDSPGIHTKNSHASATPVLRDGRLYVHFGHQGTACLDLDGKIIWRNNKLKYAPVHGNGGSPAIIDDLVAFSCDGASDPFVAALDRRTGDVRWKTPRKADRVKKFAFSTPLVIAVDGRKQIVSAGAGSIGGFDPTNGREIWRVNYDGYSVVPRPVFGHGLIYMSTGFDSPEILAIRPDGTGDVTETHVVWRLSKGAPNTPSLLLAGDELYAVSDRGIASCIDAKTGQVHWQERVRGNFSASPLLADGLIYLQNEEGMTTILRAGKLFERLAENKLGERTLASPAPANGALFIRTEKHLFRVQR
jgi:outer membrane protein assembly factor BamB